MLNIAHRGASAYAPENTFAAFYKAADMSADGIEIDVRVTSDKKLVLFHDLDMLKKTGRKGSICDYEYEEIRQMEVGSWFSPDYEGERIVSLEDFLFYFSKRNMEYQIELKDKDIEYEVIELLKKYDVIGKVVITSFESSILSRTKSINTNVKTGWLINRLDDLLIEKAKKLKIDILSLKAHIINENSVLYVKKNNFAIRAWNVKDVETMKKLLTFDIDGMTIDFPDKFYHVR